MKVTLEFESGEASEIEVLDKIAEMIKCNVPCGMAIRGDNAGKNVTGYERVKQEEKYYTGMHYGKPICLTENGNKFDYEQYKSANYYSDETIAKNNARADKLYRQLRRFAVEHRETAIDWNNDDTAKYHMAFRHGTVEIATTYLWRTFADIYFDSKESAQLALDTFHDEILWYFTEYKDSL